jgi:hypothetical protein
LESGEAIIGETVLHVFIYIGKIFLKSSMKNLAGFDLPRKVEIYIKLSFLTLYKSNFVKTMAAGVEGAKRGNCFYIFLSLRTCERDILSITLCMYNCVRDGLWRTIALSA